ncbi:hypothetical protein ACVW01_000792 [Thermostichus sp. MS-CIW-19]|jgi:hypothetical protein|nr:hypothetical protein SYN63AY4M2_12425 [Synechococcus sp. 63AY4M2]PIK89667.1 hypothetical protein SYN65AY6A5_02695 [Synechococcus sp. 65AY6A5]PIK96546.1 hypothetical protein SYN60AY4M2_13050 [Synechococcus sp. 60AY4M2]PIL02406.1 hypothetical protein SYN65AY640_03660 [Synechococcus sp. 65AY640]
MPSQPIKRFPQKSMTLVNDMLDYTENNVQYVQYGCLAWLDM